MEIKKKCVIFIKIVVLKNSHFLKIFIFSGFFIDFSLNPPNFPRKIKKKHYLRQKAMKKHEKNENFQKMRIFQYYDFYEDNA